MIDLHVHTCYCDGHDSPEQMVLSAIDRGVTTLGIVAHYFGHSRSLLRGV